jgi:two-component system cell cycle response regulator
VAEKILIVDDDPDTLKLLGLILGRQGFDILSASTGRQALDLARSHKFDLVVLDVMMPVIDGLEVARRLRSDPKTQDLAILMFSAKTQAEDLLEGYRAGADDYLTKPVQPTELIARVRLAMDRMKRTDVEG